MTSSITATSLSKRYPGGVQALNGVTFEVQSGSIFALLGPNGAGKSTTVKILTTLGQPDAGSATVAGVDVLRQPGAVRRQIGVVAQRPGVDREATGRENLMLQGRLYGLRGRDLKRRSGELLDRFELQEAGSRPAGTYSGGMQRRLDVAMGMMHKPRVLFLDEPTAGLDPEARVLMWEEIARLKSEERLTVLLTTHYLDEADRLADQLAIMDNGKIVIEGAPGELKAQVKDDTLSVDLAAAPVDDRVLRTVERVAGISEAVIEGSVLRARSQSGATAVPVLLGALDSAGIGVSSVTVARASLDDVFLRYAGHAFAKSGHGAV